MNRDLERMLLRMDVALGKPLDRHGIPSTPELQILRFYDPEVSARVTADGRRIVGEMIAKIEAAALSSRDE